MSGSIKKTVAEQVAAFLQSKGIEYLFGVPGGENVALIEAFRREGIRFILTHHETPAAYAADVTGQLTGRPGICMATVGPGAVNLLAGAAAATLERSPLLAITAEVDLSWQRQVTHMQLDLNWLFQPVTKGTFALRPETALADLQSAWSLALTPPFGAVHLALAPDVARMEAIVKLPTHPGITSPGRPSLTLAREAIQSADKVFILAGVGVEMAVAQPALLTLAEAWGVPVAVTPKAKGHFPDGHPLYAGCFSAYGDRALRRALEETDLILGVGLDGVDFVTSTWEITTPVINLTPWAAPDPVTRPMITLAGELAVLLREMTTWRSRNSSGEKEAGRIRQTMAGDLKTGARPNPGNLRLLPLITSLREALPADGAVTVDVGVFKLVFLQAWETEFPKTLFVANGLSAMGYAVPGALAVKLASPKRPVVAIVGDGALQMYAGELGTVAREGYHVVILVIVDHALSLIRLKQIRQETPIYGTEFGQTDYASLAKAYGLEYLLIADEASASRDFRTAILSPKPILVEARVDREEYNHFK